MITLSLTRDDVGTAALGCPVEHRSTDFAGQKLVGALLRETAEGGCPHALLVS